MLKIADVQMFGVNLIPASYKIIATLALGIFAAGASFSSGYVKGRNAERLAWEQKQDKADARDATALATEIRAAAAVGLRIADGLRDVATARAQTIIRTRTIVQEVSNAIDATPALAECILPDAVLRLRAEQVESSKAAAAVARRAAGK